MHMFRYRKKAKPYSLILRLFLVVQITLMAILAGCGESYTQISQDEIVAE